MSHAVATWAIEATQLPLAFSQVREDPLLDLWVVERLRPESRVILIASGGCTAALLVAAPNIARLHLVDANPAQLALTRLKLCLLGHPRETRLACLGHIAMPTEARGQFLAETLAQLALPPNALGPADRVAALGPDFAARYELAFAALQSALNSTPDLAAVLRLSDPAEQARRVDPATSLGQAIDAAMDSVLSLANLVQLFGEEATRNPVAPFSRHFAGRIRHALATLPAATNPYLWQMLRGCYPDQVLAPWLMATAPETWPAITQARMFMADALHAEPNEFDFVHLSNILDWLSPEQATATLAAAHQALRPGGWVLIRQLNSSLNIPSLGPMFEWLPEAAELHARDRSFFYRAIHLGRKR